MECGDGSCTATVTTERRCAGCGRAFCPTHWVVAVDEVLEPGGARVTARVGAAGAAWAAWSSGRPAPAVVPRARAESVPPGRHLRAQGLDGAWHVHHIPGTLQGQPLTQDEALQYRRAWLATFGCAGCRTAAAERRAGALVTTRVRADESRLTARAEVDRDDWFETVRHIVLMDRPRRAALLEAGVDVDTVLADRLHGHEYEFEARLARLAVQRLPQSPSQDRSAARCSLVLWNTAGDGSRVTLHAWETGGWSVLQESGETVGLVRRRVVVTSEAVPWRLYDPHTGMTGALAELVRVVESGRPARAAWLGRTRP